MTKQERIVGIDILRILSMFMVVVLHVLGHGGILANAEALSFKWFIVSGIEALCIIGVNCFALITGYVNGEKTFKLKNIINLGLQVFFYSIVISMIFYICGFAQFSLKGFIGFLFPVISNRSSATKILILLFLIDI